MPANRSRTDRWRECLDQLHQRAGVLEISVERPEGAENAGGDLVWRVRILGLSDAQIVVEHPTTLGETFRFPAGTRLLGCISIGQNRWMFQSTVLGWTSAGGEGLRITMPDKVERCQRRSFYRMSAAGLSLPRVECWPLLNPRSVVAAEVANRARILELIAAGSRSPDASIDPASILLPEVGPMFEASLVNIGGGGAGLNVSREQVAAIDRTRLLWLRISLRPQVPAPLAVTARIAHTHLDSTQNTYMGLAFDFTHHAEHRPFVVGQIVRYVNEVQALQRARASA